MSDTKLSNTDKPWPECFDVILGDSGDVGSTRLVRKSDFDAIMEGSAEWEDEARLAKLVNTLLSSGWQKVIDLIHEQDQIEVIVEW